MSDCIELQKLVEKRRARGGTSWLGVIIWYPVAVWTNNAHNSIMWLLCLLLSVHLHKVISCKWILPQIQPFWRLARGRSWFYSLQLEKWMLAQIITDSDPLIVTRVNVGHIFHNPLHLDVQMRRKHILASSGNTSCAHIFKPSHRAPQSVLLQCVEIAAFSRPSTVRRKE